MFPLPIKKSKLPILVVGPFSVDSMRHFVQGTSVVLPALLSLSKMSAAGSVVLLSDQENMSTVLHQFSTVWLLGTNPVFAGGGDAAVIQLFCKKLHDLYPWITFNMVDHIHEVIQMAEEHEPRVIRLDPHLNFTATSWRQILERSHQLYDDDAAVANSYQRIVFKSVYQTTSLWDMNPLHVMIMFMTAFKFLLFSSFAVRWIYWSVIGMTNFFTRLLLGLEIFGEPTYPAMFFATAETIIFPTGFKNGSFVERQKVKRQTLYETLSEAYYVKTNMDYYPNMMSGSWFKVPSRDVTNLLQFRALEMADILLVLYTLTVLMNLGQTTCTYLLVHYLQPTHHIWFSGRFLTIIAHLTLLFVVYMTMRPHVRFTNRRFGWLNLKFIFFPFLISWYILWRIIYSMAQLVYIIF